MKPTKLIASFIALLMVTAIASDIRADISNAAVLYLRIAPGGRAAAMGEAYVAIADDATATHWNPAGLGAYPLADAWKDVSVPSELRPVQAMVTVKSGSASNYLAYDIWAITARGLARFDNKKWHFQEEFRTKASDKVKKIVASYFSLTDEERIAEIADKVAIANNRHSYSYLDSLKSKILTAIPADYSSLDALTSDFDSLLAAYNLCLVNWDKVKEAGKLFKDGMKDSLLTEKESDRINFAVEKARNRFIPEDLIIPYSVLLSSELTLIASTGSHLMVGTDAGLVAYDGRRWQTFTEGNGLPSNNVLHLSSGANAIYIGTEAGLVKYSGTNLLQVGEKGTSPVGRVTGIGATGKNDVWAIVDRQLYHYDGKSWSNGRSYTVALDDTPEKIADKFALYGTAAEKEKYLTLFKEMNLNPPVTEIVEPVVDTLAADTAEAEVAQAEGETEVTEETAEQTTEAVAESSDELVLAPGMVITVPYLAEVKGDVNTIYIGVNGHVWLGTSYGVAHYNLDGWQLPGYREHTVEPGQTWDSLAVHSGSRNPAEAEAYLAAIRDISDMGDEPLVEGQTVKVYRNPTASPVRKIKYRRGHLYFATASGLVEYYEDSWSRVELHKMDKANVINVETFGDELWIASDERIVIKANGKTDISMMAVKWLPELADDMYYAFLSFVTSKEGLGTFGGNITGVSYGSIQRTDDVGNPQGTFEPFDISFTLSYGTSLNSKLKIGGSAKIIYSHLTDVGAGIEVGEGTATAFAGDIGLLYEMNDRLNFGLAITNLGPDISYVDAAQSDPLPRNFAFGFAYKLLRSDYYHFLITAEVNKSLVGLDDGFSEEMKQLVFNGGGEILYANIFAVRFGYIFDEEGDVKTVTVGAGLSPWQKLKFDFAYIPSDSAEALANTLRVSMSFLL